MKKLISTILAFTMLIISNTVLAYPLHNDWANESIIACDGACMFENMTDITDFTKPIPRGDIAELVVRAYENVTNLYIDSYTDHFADVSSDYPQMAYALGLMNGTGDTTFSPDDFTTREAMAKILLTLFARVNNEEPMLPNNPTSHFKDFDTVSDWAKPYVAEGDNMGLLNGFEDITFRPRDLVSYEQACVFITRAVKLKDVGYRADWAPTPEPTPEVLPMRELNVSGYVSPTQEFGETRIKWSSGINALVTVTVDRNSYYTEDIAPKTFTYNCNGYLDIKLLTNCKYEITIPGVKTVSFKTTKGTNTGADAIKATYPTNKADADAMQTDVTVPVWLLRNGKKVEGKMELTVHQGIAEKVKLVFEEIFNGEEKFPVKAMGAYAWRGDGGEHNGGTAIDINANENYCLYSNGTVVGNYWKPYEDPYSINPYGDVIYAFEKYGFTWGGDAWRGTKDYMHFSYLGR